MSVGWDIPGIKTPRTASWSEYSPVASRIRHTCKPTSTTASSSSTSTPRPNFPGRNTSGTFSLESSRSLPPSASPGPLSVDIFTGIRLKSITRCPALTTALSRPAPRCAAPCATFPHELSLLGESPRPSRSSQLGLPPAFLAGIFISHSWFSVRSKTDASRMSRNEGKSLSLQALRSRDTPIMATKRAGQ